MIDMALLTGIEIIFDLICAVLLCFGICGLASLMEDLIMKMID